MKRTLHIDYTFREFNLRNEEEEENDDEPFL